MYTQFSSPHRKMVDMSNIREAGRHAQTVAGSSAIVDKLVRIFDTVVKWNEMQPLRTQNSRGGWGKSTCLQTSGGVV